MMGSLRALDGHASQLRTTMTISVLAGVLALRRNLWISANEGDHLEREARLLTALALIKLSWLMAAVQITYNVAVIESQLPQGLVGALIAIVCVLLPAIWLIMFLLAVVKFGWRGCWLLLPAPFCIGLVIPIMVLVAVFGDAPER
jgi:hypothetical protein